MEGDVAHVAVKIGLSIAIVISVGAVYSMAPAEPFTVTNPAVDPGPTPNSQSPPADTNTRFPATIKNLGNTSTIIAESSLRRRVAKTTSPKMKQMMERAAIMLEEYGSATVSAPLLSRPDSVFKFDYTHGAATYFHDAKSGIQGSAASMTDVSNIFSLGVQAQLDPTVMGEYVNKLAQFNADQSRIQQRRSMLDNAANLEYFTAVTAASRITDPGERASAIAAAQRAYAEKLAPPSSATPVFPSFSSARYALPTAPVNLAKEPTTGSTLPFQGLASALNTATPTINNRSALVMAAGDQAVEGIFKVLGSPGEAQKFKDRTALFGVMMVSVDPGWRTQKDFAADIAVRTRYKYEPARPEVIIRMLSDEAINGNLRRKIAADTGLVSKLPKTLVNKDYAAENAAIEVEITARKEKAKLQAEAQKQSEKSKSDKIIASIDKKILGSGTKSGELLRNLRKDEVARITEILKGLNDTCTKYIDSLNEELTNRQKKVDDEKTAMERSVADSLKSVPRWLKYNSNEDDRRSPVVTAISPMTETEVLDLADSNRKKEALALSLSFALRYAGLGAQAEAFEKFAKTRQKDVRTRSGIAAVNTYSNSGGVFGFQIGPRLRAIADPASTDGAPGNILERQSFPALVAFGFDNDDLRPRLKMEGEKVLVMEPMLRLTQVTRWMPLKHEFFSWRDWFTPKNWQNPRISEVELLDLIEAGEEQRTCGEEAENTVAEGTTNEAQRSNTCRSNLQEYIADRQELLSFATTGSNLALSLPADMVVPLDKALLPQPSSIVPPEAIVVKKQDGSIPPRQQTFAIFGKGLAAVNLQEIKVLSGAASVNKDADKAPALVDGAIRVVLDVKGAEVPIILQLPFDPVKAGIDEEHRQMWISTQPIPVALITEKSKPAQPSQTVAAPKPSKKEVAYEKSVDATGKTTKYSISYDASAPDSSVIGVAKSILEPSPEKKAECTGDVVKLKSLCFSNP